MANSMLAGAAGGRGDSNNSQEFSLVWSVRRFHKMKPATNIFLSDRIVVTFPKGPCCKETKWKVTLQLTKMPSSEKVFFFLTYDLLTGFPNKIGNSSLFTSITAKIRMKEGRPGPGCETSNPLSVEEYEPTNCGYLGFSSPMENFRLSPAGMLTMNLTLTIWANANAVNNNSLTKEGCRLLGGKNYQRNKKYRRRRVVAAKKNGDMKLE